MEYLLSIYSIDKRQGVNGVIVSAVNSFIDMGAKINEDKLTIILWRKFIDLETEKIISKINYLNLIYIDDFFADFEKWYFGITKHKLNPGNEKFDNKIIFLGILISTFYALNFIKDSYVLIENDIFSLKEPKQYFDINLNKVQLLQGNKNNCNSLIFYCPKNHVGKMNDLFKTILIENDFDTTKFWRKFKDYIDDEFVFLEKMIYHTEYSLELEYELVHRSNSLLQKEFKIYNETNNENLFNRAVELNIVPKNQKELESVKYLSNFYFEKLLKTSKLLKLEISKSYSDQKKHINKLEERIFDFWEKEKR